MKKFLIPLAGIAWLVATGPAALAQTVLYNNGTLATGTTTRGNGAGGAGVTSPAGTQWSELAIGNTSAGSSAHPGTAPAFRLADDFTLTAASDLTSIRVYAYSTGSTTASVFANANLQIWSGRPGDVGSTVVFGDTTTNRLGSSVFSNIYRVFATTNPIAGGVVTAPGTTRPVMEISINAPVSLAAGSYWIDYQITPIAGFASTFAPTTTNPDGVTRGPAGANARQNTGTWVDVVDAGSPATEPDIAQEFPFQVVGTAVPEPGSMALCGIAVAGGIAGWRRRKVAKA